MNKVNHLCLVVATFVWLVIEGLSLAATPKTDNAALVYYQALTFVDDMATALQVRTLNHR